MEGNRLSSTPPQPSEQARREQDIPVYGVSDLPLLELFTKLQNAGLPLGIDEYQLVLQALQGGFGISDQVALKRLCQTLWVKSAEEKRLFDYQFEQMMGDEAVLQTSETLALTSRQRQLSQITRYVALAGTCIIGIGIIWWIISSNQNLIGKNQTNQNQTPGLNSNQTQNIGTNPSPNSTAQTNLNPTQKNGTVNTQLIVWSFVLLLLSVPALTTAYTIVRWVGQRLSAQTASDNNSLPQVTTSVPTSDISSRLTQVIEDEVQVAQAVLHETSRNDQIFYGCFILSADYLPITQRQMKQMWRHLRRMIREGMPSELDVEATVQQIGYQGNLLEPVIIPRRVNQTELLLLIDQDGSMIPFHSLSQRLAETALRGGRLGISNIYYFHNCPVEHIYEDPYHQQAELIQSVLAKLRKERTVVLIFSDAGAARGGFNPERIDLTEAFVKRLKQHVGQVAWLNPMPKKRWLGTTSGEIARLIPMFEVNRQGVQNAIDVLRGRSTNIEGRGQ